MARCFQCGTEQGGLQGLCISCQEKETRSKKIANPNYLTVGEGIKLILSKISELEETIKNLMEVK